MSLGLPVSSSSPDESPEALWGRDFDWDDFVNLYGTLPSRRNSSAPAHDAAPASRKKLTSWFRGRRENGVYEPLLDGDVDVEANAAGTSRCPEEDANWLSKLFFVYVGSLIRLGATKHLEQEDLWDMARQDEAGHVSDALQRSLDRSDRTVWRAIVRTHGRKFAAAGVVKVVHDLVMFSQPYILSLLLEQLNTAADIWMTLRLAALMAGASVLETLLVNVYFTMLFRITLHLKSGLIQMLYSKSLKVSAAIKSEMGVGAIVNLQSNDASKIWMLPQYLHIIWNGPFQILVVMGLLVRVLHLLPSLAGLGVTIVMIPASALVGRALGKLRRQMLLQTDARVKLASEVITGIKAIKLYAWEVPYVQRILELRNKELAAIFRTLLLGLINSLVFLSGPVLVSIAAFATHAALGFQLTAAAAFPALALFNLLRFPISVLPMQIISIVNARVGVKRLQKFMDARENKEAGRADRCEEGMAINICAASFTWQPEEPPLLHDISLHVPRGQLVMIVGEVGAGKSSLLNAILREMYQLSGTLCVDGSTAYTAQEPWIQNSTVRENILMGEPLQQHRYEAVIRACALLADLEMLQAGDATEIGEKGINLSGGQKHRVALARACYADADIYLLDDPLSAVDAHVGRWLFDNCIRGLLGGKTRVLVTHQLQYLPAADSILVMSRGRVVAQGTFQQLQDRGMDLHVYTSADAAADAAAADATADAATAGTTGGAAVAKKPAADAHMDGDAEAAAPWHVVEAVAAGPEGHEHTEPLTGPAAELLSVPPTVSTLPVVEEPVATAVDLLEQVPPVATTGAADVHEHPRDSAAPEPVVPPPSQRRAVPCEVTAGGAESGAGAQPVDEGGRLQASPAAPSANGTAGSAAEAPPSATAHRQAVAAGAAAQEGEGARMTSALGFKEREGKLVKGEERAVGRVSRSVYRVYLSSWSKYYLIPIGLLTAALVERLLTVIQNYVLSDWSNATAAAAGGDPQQHPARRLLSQLLAPLAAVSSSVDTRHYLLLYFVLGMSAIAAAFLRALFLVFGTIAASRRLHEQLLRKVVRLPMSFFDSQPTGRLLNRFTKDTEAVDIDLAGVLNFALACFVAVAMSLGVVLAVTPGVVVAVVPLAFAYYKVQGWYIGTSRELKRLDALAYSPIFSSFSESLAGLTTIRAFRKQDLFLQRNTRLVNSSNRCFWPIQLVNRWLSVRLELMATVVVFAAAIFVAVLLHNNAGLAGLALASALNLTGLLNWMVRQTTELEVNMNSVERLIDYNRYPEEAPAIIESNRPPPEWPTEGAIEAVDLWVRYRPELPPVLKGLTFKIRGREKVGVCGRTGCGKSTLMMTLYRIVEPSAGHIYIDGIDIGSIGLFDLRSRLTLVPQDPVIFSGSIRTNLDPFNQVREDAAVWQALQRAGIDGMVRELGGLDAPMREGGATLSTGQRQLLCMARALLRKSKILILDEATSNVDNATDALIQSTIRNAFKDCTVLTIAHRLNTIIDSDRVMLLDDGIIKEFDSPTRLLQDPNSAFAKLVAESEQQTTAGSGNGSVVI